MLIFLPLPKILYELSTADIIYTFFEDAGFPSLGMFWHYLNLTVVKISWRVRLRIPYFGYKELEFGEQKVEALELCSTSKPTDNQGYYHCFTRCPLK